MYLPQLLLLHFVFYRVFINAQSCAKGSYFHSINKKCYTCAVGTYNDEDDSTKPCKPCTKCINGFTVKTPCLNIKNAICQCTPPFRVYDTSCSLLPIPQTSFNNNLPDTQIPLEIKTTISTFVSSDANSTHLLNDNTFNITTTKPTICTPVHFTNTSTKTEMTSSITNISTINYTQTSPTPDNDHITNISSRNYTDTST